MLKLAAWLGCIAGDGYVSRDEMTKALEMRKKSEDPPGKLKEDLDQFFSLDRNKDNLISCEQRPSSAA